MELVDDPLNEGRSSRAARLNCHRNHHRRSMKRSCCLTVQLYFSYVLCLCSSSIIAFGIMIFFKTFNNLWLVLPGIGLLIILIGASIYRDAILKSDPNHMVKPKRPKTRNRYKRCSARESHIFESHLSINMLPQCFTSLDINSSSLPLTRTNRISTNNRSQYLILPIDSLSLSSLPGNHQQQTTNERVERVEETPTNPIRIEEPPQQQQNIPYSINMSHQQHQLSSIAQENNHQVQSTQPPQVTTINQEQLNSNMDEPSISTELEELEMTINEAPPSYEEVIDNDEEIIENYRNLPPNLMESGVDDDGTTSRTDLYRTL